MNLFKRYIVTAMVVVGLAGCTSMPISTMLKMSQFSPMDIEPEGLRLAIRTDQAVKLKQGAVQIAFGFESAGTDVLPSVKEEHSFKVEVLSDMTTGLPPILFEDIEPNETVTILKLSAEDADIMQKAKALIKKYKSADAKTKGFFSFGFEDQCFGNIDGFESLDVDLFLKTTTSEDYFLFMEDMDILEEAADNNVNLKEVNKC